MFVLKTETETVELTVDLTLLLLKSVLSGKVPGILFHLIVCLVILYDLTQTIDINGCSNRKLGAAEEASESGSLSRYAGAASGSYPDLSKNAQQNTIRFVISQLHFHDPASRFHFSTQNENVSE